MFMKRQERLRSWFGRGTALVAVLYAACQGWWLSAAPINPKAFSEEFEKAKKDAEVVAEARVLTVVCADTKKEGDKVRAVTLQIALQMLAVDKGPLKKNEVVVVSRDVTLPAGPGPGMYGYNAEMRRFPFTPGVKGNVALRWDKESRAYVPLAGWVAEPNNAEIPKAVGKAISAKD
jgi:hypothetical protein